MKERPAAAGSWIRRLGLKPHPEGGYYRETYRSAEGIGAAALPRRFGARRPFSTAICFLLRGGQASKLHRIKSDEVWHHYAGATLSLFYITSAGGVGRFRLGKSRGAGPQAVVKAGWWFGAEVAGGSGYALVGCTVAPGFDFRDFELADRKTLLRRFPRHRRLVERLT